MSLEAEGHVWGRNKSFVQDFVVNFRITKLITNGLYQAGGSSPTQVPIGGRFRLPSQSPFVAYHLVLVPYKHSMLKVKMIKRVWTRPIIVSTLEQFLVPLYNSTHGAMYDNADLKKQPKKKQEEPPPSSSEDDEQDSDDEILDSLDEHRPKKKKRKRTKRQRRIIKSKDPIDELMYGDEEEQKLKLRVQPLEGARWWKKYVLPVLCDWPTKPEEAPTSENIAQHMKKLYENTQKLLVSMGIDVKKRANQQLNHLDIYNIVFSKLRPCLKGPVFESLLRFFHEHFLQRLSGEQQAALHDLMNTRPELMLNWRMALYELRRGNDDDIFDVMRSNHTTLFNNTLFQSGTYNPRVPDAVYLEEDALYFDPMSPQFNWAKYLQLKTLASSTNTQVNDKILYEALRFTLKLDRYLYYDGRTSAPSMNFFL